jgi:DNA-binding winged helix-turn-helix (wHTH) protein/Tol biopolymer transport system component
MALSDLRPRTIRFGPFELDPASRELRKRGNVVKLQPQHFAVLLMLVEHRGQVVSREEIRERVWDRDTFVDFERSINFAVSQIRAALKDDTESPRFIETLPKRGYRFIAVIENDRTEEAGNQNSPIFIDRKTITAVDRGQVTSTADHTEAVETPAAPTIPNRSDDESAGIPSPIVPQTPQPAPRSMLRLGILIGGLVSLSLAFGIFWWTRSFSRTEIKERQLTRNSSDNPISAVAISGDGKYLAFADVTGLHVKLVHTGEVHDIPQPPEFGKSHVNWNIHWLPDSTRFLAVSFPIGEPPTTWQASVVGGILHKLRNDATAWSVSPDGSTVAFTTVEEREMWLMGVEGESPRRLADAGEKNWFTQIQWSPDGSRLLYIKLVPSAGRIQASMETRDLKGGVAATVLSDDRLRSLYWLPDGRLLYVLGEPDRNGDTCNYWIARIDSRTGAFSAKPEQLTHGSGFCIRSTSATADSKQIVFLKRTSDFSVYIADLEANGTRITPPKHLTLMEGQEFPAAWTADSQAVIFVSNRDGKWGFYRQPLSGDTASPILTGITSDGLGAIFPRVSPDGKWLVYAPYPSDHTPGAAMELLKVPTTGGTPQLIMKAAMYDTPRCAQAPATLCAVAIVDKDQLIFTSFDPMLGRGHELARFKIDDPNKFYGWALSPDGTRIAVLKQSTAEIHVLSLETHTEQKITVQGWNSLMALDWTSDGTGLFTSSLQPSCVLLQVDLHGNARVLWEPKGAQMTWAIPSPDGRHLAMPAFALSSNVWMMEDF